MNMETFCVPMIAMAVYVFIELIKWLVGHGEKYKRWYPIIAGGLGMAMSAAAYMTGATEIPAESLTSAIFIGLCSGLCATGTDQLIVKLLKGKDATGEDEATTAEGAKKEGEEG